MILRYPLLLYILYIFANGPIDFRFPHLYKLSLYVSDFSMDNHLSSRIIGFAMSIQVLKKKIEAMDQLNHMAKFYIDCFIFVK